MEDVDIVPVFDCPECRVNKETEEELEVHIRIEHLKWLAFKCRFCGILRETEEKMIEHYLGSHDQDESEMIYVPNMTAKKRLKFLIETARQNREAKLLSIKYQLEYESHQGEMSQNHIYHEHQSQGEAFDPPSFAANGYVVNYEQKEEEDDDDEDYEIEVDEKEPTTSTGSDVENRNQRVMKAESDSQGFEMSIAEQTNQTETGLFNSAISSLFSAKTITKSPYHNNRVTKASLKQKKSDEPGGESSEKRAPSKLVRARLSYANCARCHMKVRFCDRRAHSYMHLAEEENIFRFTCLIEGCPFGHHRRYIVRNHLLMQHNIRDVTKICDAFNDVMNEQLTVMYTNCFNELPQPTPTQLHAEKEERDKNKKPKRKRKAQIQYEDEE